MKELEIKKALPLKLSFCKKISLTATIQEFLINCTWFVSTAKSYSLTLFKLVNKV